MPVCRNCLGDRAATICDMRVPVAATGRRGCSQLLKRLEGVADPIPLHERRSEEPLDVPLNVAGSSNGIICVAFGNMASWPFGMC